MAGTVKHLRQRGTTFFVRIGVPKELRAIVGKSELHESLGGNRREAERRSHAVLARFHGILDEARLKFAQGMDAPPRLSRALDTPGRLFGSNSFLTCSHSHPWLRFRTFTP